MKSRLAFPFLIIALTLLPLLGTGCTTDPVSSAQEIRALYKEAQTQADIACKEKGTSEAKCAELKDKLAQMEPFISALEVAAAAADKDPTKFLNFQTLWVEYKPKVEAALISIVLKRYLGV